MSLCHNKMIIDHGLVRPLVEFGSWKSWRPFDALRKVLFPPINFYVWIENMYVNLYTLEHLYIYSKCYNKPTIFYFRRPQFLLSFTIKSPSLPLLSSNNSLFILLPWLAWASSLALLVSLFSLSLLQKLKKKKKFLDSQSHAPFFLLFSISSSKQLLRVLYFSSCLFAGNITAILLYASPM